MRIIMLLVCLSLLAAACAQDAPAPGPALVETVPPLSQDVLLNPRMGLYLQHPPTDAKPDEWFMQIADVAYYRLDWNEVNPEPGVYTFDKYFGRLLDFWVKQSGKRFAFRIMSESMHSAGEYVTPKWVFDQGVPGVPHVALNGKTQTDPVFWDDRYLDAQCDFVKQLGAYFADKPGLEFVDIGGIGEWGEMHLMRWTPRQLADTGFSEYRYARAYRRLIDAYVAAFPHTQIFLNIGGPDHLGINDYAAIRGVHFRQDGLMPSGASYNCGEWLYKPYSRRGVVCNFEFHSGYEDMVKKGWDVKQTLEKGLSAPISYLNTNLFGGWNIRKAPPEVQALLTDTARRIGYRFVLTSLQHLPQIKVTPDRPSRLPLEAAWRNDGVAPCYDSLAIRWLLVDAAGQVAVSQDTLPITPTTRWWPGETVTEKTLLRVPAGLKPGAYRLQLALFVPETGRLVGLGIAGKQPSGAYDLCALPAVAAEGVNQVTYKADFEAGAQPWNGTTGIAVAVAGEGGHDAPGCLTVAGTMTQSWNYASLRAGAVVPYGLYRLTAWMLVEELSETQKPPYLKLGINDATGKWLSNASTETYDVKRLGTWQKLEGLAEMPPNAGSVDIALEKGDNSTPVTIKLRLDDVRLDLIEAP